MENKEIKNLIDNQKNTSKDNEKKDSEKDSGINANTKKNDFLERIKFFEQKKVVQNKKPVIIKKNKTVQENIIFKNLSKENDNHNLKDKLDKVPEDKSTKNIIKEVIENSENNDENKKSELLKEKADIKLGDEIIKKSNNTSNIDTSKIINEHNNNCTKIENTIEEEESMAEIIKKVKGNDIKETINKNESKNKINKINFISQLENKLVNKEKNIKNNNTNNIENLDQNIEEKNNHNEIIDINNDDKEDIKKGNTFLEKSNLNEASASIFDEEKKKEKIFKQFMKKKTYDFSQLQRPSNYAEINKYLDYIKNILDIKIVDFSSKL